MTSVALTLCNVTRYGLSKDLASFGTWTEGARDEARLER